MSRLFQLLDTGAPPGELRLDCNLLLTRRCGFSCAHCMYAAGPSMPAAYMTPPVMCQIIQAMEGIKQELVLAGRMHESSSVSYNLGGGEPTLDMSKFADCVAYAAFSDLELEMTTNGWWLRSLETTGQFLKAVRPWYLKFNEGSIRISDSPYHRIFRTPEELKVLAWPGWDRVRDREDVDELRNLLHDTASDAAGVACPECNEHVEVAGFSEHRLECNVPLESLLDEYERTRDARLDETMRHQLAEMLKGGELCLYVDRQASGPDQISPVGRARQDHIAATQDGPCGRNSSSLRFTFQPDGSIYDFCCNGGKVSGGHARDGSQLLYNHLDFMTLLFEHYPERHNPSAWGWHNPWQGERCRGCSHVARQWRERKDKQTRQRNVRKTRSKLQLQMA